MCASSSKKIWVPNKRIFIAGLKPRENIKYLKSRSLNEDSLNWEFVVAKRGSNAYQMKLTGF